MDYERIDKVQTGVISPTKLRLKLLGENISRRIGSSRTSPSKIADMEFVSNGLLDSDDAFLDEASIKGSDSASATCFNMPSSVKKLVSSGSDDQGGGRKHPKDSNTKEKDAGNGMKCSPNTGVIHPTKSVEECASDSDAKLDNAIPPVFEFHRGERAIQNPVLGPFSRPLPSKWDDAEKWIMKSLPNSLKSCDGSSQMNRPKAASWVKVAPEAVVPEARAVFFQAADSKRLNSYHMPSQSMLKFPCLKSLPLSKGSSGTMESEFANEQKEVREVDLSGPETGIPHIKSVCMRDMGTEMTPVTSLEPSRMGTPLEATTPMRSFNSSRDSTPRRGSPTPSNPKSLDKTGPCEQGTVKGLSEEEFRLKTRREIVALGVKLGKMNIAAWASKEDLENERSSKKAADDDLDKAEFEARAALWEEAEKSKYMASFRRAEVNIQAWESQQKVKCEAKLREIEVQLERKRAAVQEKMMRKLARTKLQCEKRRAAAEALKSRQAGRAAKQAERIRRTGGRSSPHLLCCSMFF